MFPDDYAEKLLSMKEEELECLKAEAKQKKAEEEKKKPVPDSIVVHEW